MLNTDDDSEQAIDDHLLFQALPVAPLPKNIDLNIPPITGEDYLSRVRYQKCLLLLSR